MKMKHPPIFHIDVGMHPLSKEFQKEWQAHIWPYIAVQNQIREQLANCPYLVSFKSSDIKITTFETPPTQLPLST